MLGILAFPTASAGETNAALHKGASDPQTRITTGMFEQLTAKIYLLKYAILPMSLCYILLYAMQEDHHKQIHLWLNATSAKYNNLSVGYSTLKQPVKKPYTGNQSQLYQRNAKSLQFTNGKRVVQQVLRSSNEYPIWQTNYSSNGGSYYFYSAYLDRRIQPLITVLLLANVNNYKDIFTFYLSFDEIKTRTSTNKCRAQKITKFNSKTLFNAFLLQCSVPETVGTFIPKKVHIYVDSMREYLNSLDIIYNLPNNGVRNNFGVCVKALRFTNDEHITELVQWIEMQYILGTTGIFLYWEDLSPGLLANMTELTKKRNLELQFVSIPSEVRIGKTDWEMFILTNCFYINMYKYKYIAVVDTDEVIVPAGETKTWHELLHVVRSQLPATALKSVSSFSVTHVWFCKKKLFQNEYFPQFPRWMFLLQSVIATSPVSSINKMKSFVDTEKVVVLFHHYPTVCLNQTCSSHKLSRTLAQMHHFRVFNPVKSAVKYRNCENITELNKDTLIWKYQELIIKNVNRTFLELHFVPKDPTSK